MRPSRSSFAGLLLILATGYADAYTFLERGHVFAEAMTGNLVLIAVGAFRPAIVHVWRPLVTYLAFVLGVAAVWGVARLSGEAKDRPRAAGRTVSTAQLLTVVLEAVVLAAAGCVSSSLSGVVAPVIAFVSGMQITAFRRVEDEAFTTTVMTTNSMRTVSRALSAVVERDEQEFAAAALLGALIVAFAAGAFLGAYLSTRLGTRAAWVDAGLFAAVAGLVAIRRRARSPGRRADPPASGTSTDQAA